MARVKRGTTKNKRRKNILSQVKGHRFGYSTKERIAKEAIRHAGTHAFRDRKTKKRAYKQLWTLRINAALHEGGFPPFSKFMGALRAKGIHLDKKSLGTLAELHPETFSRLAKQVA